MSITSVLYLKDEISIASTGAVDRLVSDKTLAPFVVSQDH